MGSGVRQQRCTAAEEEDDDGTTPNSSSRGNEGLVREGEEGRGWSELCFRGSSSKGADSEHQTQQSRLGDDII